MRRSQPGLRTLRIVPVGVVPAIALATAAIVAGCGGGDGGGGGDTTAATTTSDGGGGGETVKMTEYEFDPNDLQVSAGATITADNAGKLEHNLTIEQGADAEKESKQLAATPDVQSGSAGDVTVPDDPGRHSLVCTIPGHRELGMIGTITIK